MRMRRNQQLRGIRFRVACSSTRLGPPLHGLLTPPLATLSRGKVCGLELGQGGTGEGRAHQTAANTLPWRASFELLIPEPNLTTVTNLVSYSRLLDLERRVRTKVYNNKSINNKSYITHVTAAGNPAPELRCVCNGSGVCCRLSGRCQARTACPRPCLRRRAVGNQSC